MQTERKPVNTNISLDEYRAQNENKPYAEKFFKMESSYSFLPSEVQSKLNDIDKFVETEIAEHGWKHNIAAYENVMTELAMELGVEEGSIIDQIERVAGFARSMLKLNGVDDVRKNLKQKLKRLRTQKDMDNEILKAIGKKIL